MTDPERWTRIKALFDAASALAPSERPAYLQVQCGSDDSLRAEVQSLLAVDAQADGLLERPAMAVAADLAMSPTGEGRPSLVGQRIASYLIVDRIGAGGMGDVYRARDTKLGREVAIKLLPAAFTAHAERLARFEREARVLAALNHPHIGAIYGLETHDGVPALVLELVPGDTLADRIAHGPLPIALALDCARQIADALEAAHDKGIVHRDLKPQNIKITPDGVVKVLDFGLAKTSRSNAGEPSDAPTVTIGGTRDGLILGTAAYMSPEQARGQPVDKRTDIWAFGCVLYEMLTGRAAFRGTTVSDTIAGILHRAPDLAALPTTTPPGARRLLSRCLDKDPKRRLHDIADARIEVDEALTMPSREISEIQPRRLVRSSLAWGAALLVALFAAVVAWRARGPFIREVSALRSFRSSLFLPTEVTFGELAPALRLALSPDGTRLAFSALGPDRVVRLYVRSLEALTAQPLVGTEGAVAPFWSPDSRSIGYFTGASPVSGGATNGSVKKIPADGGPAVTLCDFRATATGASWSQDDLILFTSGNGAGGGSIRRVSALGGTSSVVLAPDASRGEVEYWWPFFLPDGKHFIYLALGPEFQPIGIYVTSLASNERKLLVRGGSNAKYSNGYLTFLREQTLMAQRFDVERLELIGDPVPIAEEVAIGGGSGATGAFTVSETGELAYVTGIGSRTRLVWLDAVGKPLGPVGDEAHYGDLQLSRDGAYASVSLPDPTQGRRDIWLVDLTHGTRTRFTFDAAEERDSVWSPDGTHLAFNSQRKLVFDLYQKASNGTGGEELLLADDGDKIPLSWSPDGQFILYMRNGGTDTGWDLWVLPLSRDRKPIPFAQTRFAEGPGEFSPDGRWITYASNESGEFGLYVAPFPGPGGKVPVTTALKGAFQFLLVPRWRGPDIFYGGSAGLVAAPVQANGDVIGVGEARRVFQGRAIPYRLHSFFDVTRDGKRILVNSVADQPGLQPSITLVVNWTAGLKKPGGTSRE